MTLYPEQLPTDKLIVKIDRYCYSQVRDGETHLIKEIVQQLFSINPGGRDET